MQNPSSSKKNIKETLKVIKAPKTPQNESLRFPTFDVSEYIPKEFSVDSGGNGKSPANTRQKQYFDKFNEYTKLNH